MEIMVIGYYTDELIKNTTAYNKNTVVITIPGPVNVESFVGNENAVRC